MVAQAARGRADMVRSPYSPCCSIAHPLLGAGKSCLVSGPLSLGVNDAATKNWPFAISRVVDNIGDDCSTRSSHAEVTANRAPTYAQVFNRVTHNLPSQVRLLMIVHTAALSSP